MHGASSSIDLKSSLPKELPSIETALKTISAALTGTVALDASIKCVGSASIKGTFTNQYYGDPLFTLNNGKEVNTKLYPTPPLICGLRLKLFFLELDELLYMIQVTGVPLPKVELTLTASFCSFN